MASNQAVRFSLLCSIVLVISIPQVCCYGDSTTEAPKVALDLYYESLCPFSANFIVNLLAPIFDNGLIDIVDLKLYPWGNAKLRGDNSFTCQHGPGECLLNTVEACAIDAWPDLNQHFPFIYCVEELVFEYQHRKWRSCFEKLNLDPKPIDDCYNNEFGKELELKYAAETDALVPPHEYVPWVVVDGQPLYEDYEDFTSYVCKAYKGPTPDACSYVSSAGILKQKPDHTHSVRYTEKTANVPFLRSISSSIRSGALRVIERAGM